MIYLFIAGSYTPWLRLSSLPHDGFAFHLRWGIWPLALLGIVYQQGSILQNSVSADELVGLIMCHPQIVD
jgi:channel protein (hemolysin III family)